MAFKTSKNKFKILAKLTTVQIQEEISHVVGRSRKDSGYNFSGLVVEGGGAVASSAATGVAAHCHSPIPDICRTYPTRNQTPLRGAGTKPEGHQF